MRVSIITVCYNSEAFIAETMSSVDRQTFADKEHLIIDGASRDATLKVLEQFKQPWRQVFSEPDKGIYDAMNKGLSHARGEIIGFINSDDCYAHDTVLERVVEAFDDPAVDAVYGDLCYVRQDDVTQVVRFWQSSPYRPGKFRSGWVPPHPTFFARSDVYRRLGGFDLDYRLAADWELLARFIAVHGIRTRYLNDTLVLMRLGGATNKSLGNVWRQNQEIWRAAQRHGLHPSMSRFILGKLWSRGQQYLSRAA